MWIGKTIKRVYVYFINKKKIKDERHIILYQFIYLYMNKGSKVVYTESKLYVVNRFSDPWELGNSIEAIKKEWEQVGSM